MSANVELTARKSKLWWTIEQGSVRQVTGFECKSHQSGYLWCPEVGFTLSEQYHLFENEEAALMKLIADLKVEITHRTDVLSASEDRLRKIREETK
jgi:hypothetical protein